jgi:putative oxidoreductase
MKILMIVFRTLMGLIFIFGAVSYFLMMAGVFPAPQLEPGSVAEKFTGGLGATGYFFPVLKVVELVAGILFVVGRAVPLATVLIAPVIVNIALWHFLGDRTMPGPAVALFLIIANCIVAWYYRYAYRPLFTTK